MWERSSKRWIEPIEPRVFLSAAPLDSAPEAHYLCSAAKPSVQVSFGFDANPATLSATDLHVVNVADGQPLSLAPSSVCYDPNTKAATWEFPCALPDGNFRATLPAQSVTDVSGNPLASNVTVDFFALAGDATRDRTVDINDLYQLGSNWQGTAKTFDQGDFNYDGTVDAQDLGILSSHWQQTLATPAVAPINIPTRPPRRTAIRLVDV